MTDPSSPIAKFYPEDYEFIPDDKGREWKDCALIPFIDEIDLLAAIALVDDSALSVRVIVCVCVSVWCL